MFKKIVLPGLLAGIAMLVTGICVSALVTAIFPSLKSQYTNTQLFRAMDDPMMTLYFIHPFFLGMVLAWIWNDVKTIFSGQSIMASAWKFAIRYWFVSVSGMIISYSSFQISFIMVGSWTVSILVESIVVAFILAKLNPS